MIEYIIDDQQPIVAEIGPPESIEGEIGGEGMTAEIAVGGAIPIQPDDPYEGPFEFTPGDDMQTIATAEKYVDRNIVINPIPDNYGKITYNGSWITIT